MRENILFSPNATGTERFLRNREFKLLFYESVEEALSILGSTRDVIYFYLENVYHLKGEELADNPEVLSLTLKKILGSGARFIEHRILNNLFSRTGLKYEISNIEKNPSFTKLIDKAKTAFLTKQNSGARRRKESSYTS